MSLNGRNMEEEVASSKTKTYGGNFTRIVCWLNCTPTCSVAMLVLEKFMLSGGRWKRWRCYVRRDLSSMQRCNGEQQRKRRGGRSEQLPDWFMILHSSRHLYTYTHVLRTYITLVSYSISSSKKNLKSIYNYLLKKTCNEFTITLIHTTRRSRQYELISSSQP